MEQPVTKVSEVLERMADKQAGYAAKPHNKLAEDVTEAKTLAKAWRTAARLARKSEDAQAIESAAKLHLMDEQVSAIAGVSWDAIIDGAEEWAGQDDETIRIHTETTRAVLEAAAPYMLAPVQRPSRGWIAKNRNADGSVSIIGHFRDEGEAQKYADMWPTSFVERAS